MAIIAPPPEATLNFPTFVGIALTELPKFLEALNAPSACVDQIRFFPESWNGLKDPPSAGVTFEFKGNNSVTFYFLPRPSTEGPLAGYLRIDRIVHRVGFGGTHEEILHEFKYLHHHCGCRECHGIKYPYLPQGTNELFFLRTTDLARLQAIRRFVGRAEY